MTLSVALLPVVMFTGFALAIMPLMRSDGAAGRIVFSLIAAVLLVRYLVWRTTETLPNFTLESLWAYVYLALEIAAGASSLMVLATLSRTCKRSEETDKNLAWVKDSYPPVAIFIATYNEERSILEKTIIGAQSQSYENVLVCVLDDGRRAWLRELCERRNVFYLAREENSHAKAGNMNHGLVWLQNNHPTVEFIAILDADFVAQEKFVERSLALMKNPVVGLVQTPQHFFNADPMQHSFHAAKWWPDEQRFFFDVLMPSKDAWGNVFSCGTSSMCRRSAVELIGGFPIESVTEDMLLSIKLRSRGYATVYLNERLSMGLAPEGVGEYITQRGRWCLGAMQIIRGEYGPLSTKPISLADRIGLMDTLLYWSATFAFRIATIFVPIIYWTFGVPAFVTDLHSLLFYGGASMIAQVIVLGWFSRGRILPVMTDANQLLASTVALRAVIAGLWRPKGHKFKVTAKGGDRSNVVIQWTLMRPMIVLLSITLLATIYGVVFRSEVGSAQGGALMTLVWSYYSALIIVVAIITCIELPRIREERFECDEPVRVVHRGEASDTRIADLAVGGARLRSNLGYSVGTAVEMAIPDVGQVTGKIKEVGSDFTVVVFDDDDKVRDSIIKKLFSGRYNAPLEQISSVRIFSAIASRIAR